ncbi:MAG: HD domain-containing protein [Treponema sp.]|nr:HD domain-containing protein [Treponema sp.]
MKLYKKVDVIRTILISLFCLIINYGGKDFANFFNLPLWLDSIGTVISAYFFGPLCGAVTGISVNISYSFLHSSHQVYALTNAAIGIIVGIASEKKKLSTLFGVSSVSVIVTLASVLISLPLNIIFNEGMTGNLWGDGIIEFLREERIPDIVCFFLGEFYIDFLDKIITMLFLFALLNIVKKIRANEGKFIFFNRNLFFPGLVLIFFTIPLLPSNSIDYDTYIQTVYSAENALPCGEANDIVQTDDGILWIGTYAGLYRYNGTSFKLMSDWTSVRGVNDLYVDEEGRLWIGTNDEGLSIVIKERVVNVVDTTSGLPSDSVRSIVRSSDGLYYVGTSGALSVLTLNSGLKILSTIKDASYVSNLSAGKDGLVAAVTAGGYLLILKNQKLIWQEKLSDDKEIYTECHFDKEGRLYAGSSLNNIYSFDLESFPNGSLTVKKGKTLNCRNLKYIKKINFLDTGELFVSADNGIGYFSEGQFNTINLKEFNNSIDNMTVDYQGNLWFTSSRQGLLRLSLSSFVNLYSKLNITPAVVNTVFKWNDLFFFGTDDGLVIADLNSEKLIHNSLTQKLENVRIRCIKESSDGKLWICTYGKGLYCLNPDESINIFDSSKGLCGNRIRLLIELSDLRLLVSGDQGLSFIKNGKIEKSLYYKKDLGASKVLSLEEYQDEFILCGTDGDGLTILKDDKLFKTVTNKTGLTSGVVLRTVKDSFDGVFLVTSNSLCHMDRNFNVRSLSYFPYFNNYDLFFDGKGNILVSGSSGLYVACEKSVIEDKEKYNSFLLDSKSGLSSSITVNSWNYVDSKNNLYLSCGNGVYTVNLESFMTGKHSYRMKFGKVLLDGKKKSVDSEHPLLVSRDTKKIEIYPEVINYTVFEPLVKWWLEGFDSIPIVMPQRDLNSISYTNIPSGKYVFHLAVLDPKDSSEIESIKQSIIKEKRLYDTSLFKIYMIFVALIAVAWFSWFFVHINFQHILLVQKKELEFTKEQVKLGNATVLAIAKAVDAKDENTAQHSFRVSEYSVLIAKELKFSEAEQENLRRAALLHDIGKIGIPDSVLKKAAALDEDEYKIMKSHVTRGADILKDFTMIDHVSDGVLYHHERWDGKGYAKGLQGEEIPIYGRIIGIADAFDAMTANRVYRKKQTVEYVLSELKKGRGSQFDPQLVDIMLNLISSGKINLVELLAESNE